MSSFLQVYYANKYVKPPTPPTTKSVIIVYEQKKLISIYYYTIIRKIILTVFNRFSKASVMRLAEMLFPMPASSSDRGKPFNRLQKTCSALHLLGSGSFMRVEGVCSGGAKATAWRMLYKFVEAILQHKDEFIKMPDREARDENARNILKKYKIFNAVAGVDGCHIILDDAPRKIPPGMTQEQFRNRLIYYMYLFT